MTTAEPLFRATSESAVGERSYDDLRWGVPAVRDWLAESAGDPRSTDTASPSRGSPTSAGRSASSASGTASRRQHRRSAALAGRALCHLRGFERGRDGLDPDRIVEGVAPATLFEPKRRVVRRVREYVDGSDPLVSWLASEPARLLTAGEVSLEPDSLADSRATARTVCLAFYRHALGYAEAIPDVAARLERR